MESKEGGDQGNDLESRVKARITRTSASAQAFTEALGLPPEAKYKVISRMALGDRPVPDTLVESDMPQASTKHTGAPQESSDDPAKTT